MKRINPYKLFVGCFLPNWLLRRKELSQGSKLCYARLAQYAGENGECYPGQDALAEELAVDIRQVRRYIAELVQYKLIETELRGMPAKNHYHFLWHDWMELQVGQNSPSSEDICDPSDRTYTTSKIGRIRPPEENHVKRISEERVAPSLRSGGASETSEPTSPSPEKPKKIKRQTAHFFPDDFPREPPDHFIEWATVECPEVDIRREWKRMLDQEFDKPKSDWWRTAKRWMRNAPQFNGHSARASPRQKNQANKDEQDAMFERVRRELFEPEEDSKSR